MRADWERCPFSSRMLLGWWAVSRFVSPGLSTTPLLAVAPGPTRVDSMARHGIDRSKHEAVFDWARSHSWVPIYELGVMPASSVRNQELGSAGTAVCSRQVYGKTDIREV